MGIFDRMRKREHVTLTAKDIKSARAIFESEDRQRIDLTVTTEEDYRVTIELSPKLAHKAILEMGIAYNTINPPLTNPRPMNSQF